MLTVREGRAVECSVKNYDYLEIYNLYQRDCKCECYLDQLEAHKKVISPLISLIGEILNDKISRRTIISNPGNHRGQVNRESPTLPGN